MSKFRTLMALIALTTVMALAAGCNTLEGAGEDVEQAGEAVQDAAN